MRKPDETTQFDASVERNDNATRQNRKPPIHYQINGQIRHCPYKRTTLKCNLQTKNKRLANVCGLVESKVSFEEKTGLRITSFLS